MEMVISTSLMQRMKSKLVNWLPWSVLRISGLPCRARAFSNGLTQNRAPMVLDSRQDSTRRLTQSITATR